MTATWFEVSRIWLSATEVSQRTWRYPWQHELVWMPCGNIGYISTNGRSWERITPTPAASSQKAGTGER